MISHRLFLARMFILLMFLGLPVWKAAYASTEAAQKMLSLSDSDIKNLEKINLDLYVKDITLTERKGQLFYHAIGERRGRLFSLIPLRAQVIVTINMTTSAVEIKFPWWSFAVWW